jgi:translation initiation factor IF-2
MTVSRRTSSPRSSASSASTARRPGGPSRSAAPSRHAATGPSTATHSPEPGTASSPSPTDARPVSSPAAWANAAACPVSRPSAPASAVSDRSRGRRLRPCSRSRTAVRLRPDRAASSRCVSPAARRHPRTNPSSRAPRPPCPPSITTPHSAGSSAGRRSARPHRASPPSVPIVRQEDREAVPPCRARLVLGLQPGPGTGITPHCPPRGYRHSRPAIGQPAARYPAHAEPRRYSRPADSPSPVRTRGGLRIMTSAAPSAPSQRKDDNERCQDRSAATTGGKDRRRDYSGPPASV